MTRVLLVLDIAAGIACGSVIIGLPFELWGTSPGLCFGAMMASALGAQKCFEDAIRTVKRMRSLERLASGAAEASEP